MSLAISSPSSSFVCPRLGLAAARCPLFFTVGRALESLLPSHTLITVVLHRQLWPWRRSFNARTFDVPSWSRCVCLHSTLENRFCGTRQCTRRRVSAVPCNTRGTCPQRGTQDPRGRSYSTGQRSSRCSLLLRWCRATVSSASRPTRVRSWQTRTECSWRGAYGQRILVKAAASDNIMCTSVLY